MSCPLMGEAARWPAERGASAPSRHGDDRAPRQLLAPLVRASAVRGRSTDRRDGFGVRRLEPVAGLGTGPVSAYRRSVSIRSASRAPSTVRVIGRGSSMRWSVIRRAGFSSGEAIALRCRERSPSRTSLAARCVPRHPVRLHQEQRGVVAGVTCPRLGSRAWTPDVASRPRAGSASAWREDQMQHVDVVARVLRARDGRGAACSVEGAGPAGDRDLDRVERERPDPCHLPAVQHSGHRALDENRGVCVGLINVQWTAVCPRT
jgi:hypothetical protein